MSDISDDINTVRSLIRVVIKWVGTHSLHQYDPLLVTCTETVGGCMYIIDHVVMMACAQRGILEDAQGVQKEFRLDMCDVMVHVKRPETLDLLKIFPLSRVVEILEDTLITTMLSQFVNDDNDESERDKVIRRWQNNKLERNMQQGSFTPEPEPDSDNSLILSCTPPPQFQSRPSSGSMSPLAAVMTRAEEEAAIRVQRLQIGRWCDEEASAPPTTVV